MNICIFEDNKYSDLAPLILSRPVYDLLSGTFTLKEKILNSFKNNNYSLHCRKYLQKLNERNNPGIKINHFPHESCLFINGRVIADSNLKSLLDTSDNKKKIFTNNNQLVAVYFPEKEIDSVEKLQDDLFDLNSFDGFEKQEVNIPLVSYIWELIKINGDEIKKDFGLRHSSHLKLNFLSEAPANIHLVNEEQIFIEENVTLKPGTVLDASEGPIYIEKNTVIHSNVVIEGPCFIGESSIVKSRTSISNGTTIGKVCKVGGEIEQSVIMPYSNKQHNGFLGTSYLGSWINIGAGTNNSTLKNNYGKIKVNLNGKEIDTGLQFLGLVMGDHAKCAINSMFNTGTIIGFSSNLFVAGFPDRYIPSFSWCSTDSIQVYDFKKSIETARMVTARRKVNFSNEDEKLFEDIFELTKNDRDKKGF